jgi:hypothetical protein
VSLKTDYLDYIPSTPNRKYHQIDNGDGTVSFEDVTVYTQVGDKFGATKLNELGNVVNAGIVEHLDCTKPGTVYALTGLTATSGIVSCNFTVPSLNGTYAAGDTFTVNGTAYTIQTPDGLALTPSAFVSGATVSVILDITNHKINICVPPKSNIVTATLTAAGWTGSAAPYSQTISVAGVTTTSVNEVFPGASFTASQLTALQSANLQDGGQAAGTITLLAYGDKPTIDIPVRVIVRGDM